MHNDHIADGTSVERTWLPVALVDHGMLPLVSIRCGSNTLDQRLTVWAKRIAVMSGAAPLVIVVSPGFSTMLRLALTMAFVCGATGMILVSSFVSRYIISCHIDIEDNSFVIASTHANTRFALSDLLGFQIVSRSHQEMFEYQLIAVFLGATHNVVTREVVYASCSKERVLNVARTYRKFIGVPLLENEYGI